MGVGRPRRTFPEPIRAPGPVRRTDEAHPATQPLPRTARRWRRALWRSQGHSDASPRPPRERARGPRRAGSPTPSAPRLDAARAVGGLGFGRSRSQRRSAPGSLASRGTAPRPRPRSATPREARRQGREGSRYRHTSGSWGRSGTARQAPLVGMGARPRGSARDCSLSVGGRISPWLPRGGGEGGLRGDRLAPEGAERSGTSGKRATFSLSAPPITERLLRHSPTLGFVVGFLAYCECGKQDACEHADTGARPPALPHVHTSC
jgi:hypothetical protein